MNEDKNTNEMPLNKFISHSGYSSRRDAVEIVKSGKVYVNGVRIIEPGFKVFPEDKVTIDGKQIFKSKELVYILLNKPVNVVTTTEDPQKRKKVTDLVKKSYKTKSFPDW